MLREIRGCGVALALLALFGASAVHAQTAVHAQVSGSRVYVDFAVDQTALRQIDSRLSSPSPVTVTWVVELRRVSRNWPDRPFAHTTVQMFVRQAQESDRFEVTRRYNGERLTDVVDRETLYDLISAFRFPLFEITDVPPGPYRVSVRAVVDGGSEAPVSTSILASADVEPGP